MRRRSGGRCDKEWPELRVNVEGEAIRSAQTLKRDLARKGMQEVGGVQRNGRVTNIPRLLSVLQCRAGIAKEGNKGNVDRLTRSCLPVTVN